MISTYCAATENRKARVFGGLVFQLLYVSDGERRRICRLLGEKDRDPEELQKLPGITCYFVKRGDITKKFYTTTDKIRELNELKTETLTPMQQLLVERV